jgi:tetratricopeptide (TPR) repeat protein
LDLGKEAERRASAIDDIGRKVAATTVRSAAQNFYGTPIEAVATGEQAVSLAEEWGNPGWLNFAEYGLGQAYFIAGRYREAERMLGRACAQLMGPQASAPIGTTPQYMLLVCCMMKSITHTTLGEIDAADHYQQRAQEIADESQRPFDRVAAAYSGAALKLGRDDPEAAAILLDEAFALAQEHGVRLFVPIIGCYRGIAYLELERIDAARRILAGAQEAAKSVGYTSMVLRTSIYLALALSQIGEAPTALDLVQDARNTARQQGFSGLEAEAMLCEAMVTPAANEADKAAIMGCLQDCIAIATRSEAKPLLLKAERLLDRVFVNAEGGAAPSAT